MSTIQVEQGQGAWLEFQILEKNTDLPIVLVEASQVKVFYKKFGELQFTELTPLITVADKSDPQPGENYVEIGFGVYAIYFTGDELDTLETFTWVVIPKAPASLDFKQWTQQVDVVVSTNFIQTISDIDAVVTDIDQNVTDGFDDTALDLSDIQNTLDIMQATLDATQRTVDDIEHSLPAGINTSFTE